jgi:hypothetical protein
MKGPLVPRRADRDTRGLREVSRGRAPARGGVVPARGPTLSLTFFILHNLHNKCEHKGFRDIFVFFSPKTVTTWVRRGRILQT